MRSVGSFIVSSIYRNPHTTFSLLCRFRLFNNNSMQHLPIQATCLYTNDASSGSTIPTNPLSEIHSASSQTECGVIYDKRPFKMRCEKGKKYSWCLCGRSKNQPLCDGTHKSPYLKITQRPVRFVVTEDKDYWLCNCKQTSNRPFCDGTHKREDIQAAIKS